MRYVGRGVLSAVVLAALNVGGAAAQAVCEWLDGTGTLQYVSSDGDSVTRVSDPRLGCSDGVSVVADSAVFHHEAARYEFYDRVRLEDPAIHLEASRVQLIYDASWTGPSSERAQPGSERTNRTGAQLGYRASGNVVLTIGEGARRIESAELHYDGWRGMMWSDSATTFRMGTQVARGSGFRSDLAFENITIYDIRGDVEFWRAPIDTTWAGKPEADHDSGPQRGRERHVTAILKARGCVGGGRLQDM